MQSWSWHRFDRHGIAARVAVAVAIACATVSATTLPASAVLRPAPGTGHGALGGPPPGEQFGSLEYGAGLGAGCPVEPGQIEPSPYTYNESETRDHGVVGLPVSVCIGQFPTAAIHVTVTPPGGTPIALSDLVIKAPATSTDFELLVLPAPPYTKYRIADFQGSVRTGRLNGDGSGTYTVRAQGGAQSTTETFVLDAPPKPRILNLTELLPTTKRGSRLQFGVAGMPPLQTFQVGIFGGDSGSRAGHPLRAVIVGRADRRGQAIVTLDVLSTSPTGDFNAVLDPKTPITATSGLEPRIALFEVGKA